MHSPIRHKAACLTQQVPEHELRIGQVLHLCITAPHVAACTAFCSASFLHRPVRLLSGLASSACITPASLPAWTVSSFTPCCYICLIILTSIFAAGSYACFPAAFAWEAACKNLFAARAAAECIVACTPLAVTSVACSANTLSPPG